VLNILAKIIGIIYNFLTTFTIWQMLAGSTLSFGLIFQLILSTVISPIVFILYIIAVYNGYTYFNRIKEASRIGHTS
jgi:hypothetical protein